MFIYYPALQNGLIHLTKNVNWVLGLGKTEFMQSEAMG